MKRWRQTSTILVITAMAVLVSMTLAQAKKPADAGGGGGDSAAYRIISLPLPDGEGHYGVLESISDLGSAGEVRVVGWGYDSSADEDRPYCWTVDATGGVLLEDLGAWFWERTDLDVNSAGVICGGMNTEVQSPGVLLPDGTFVVLQAAYSSVRLNNPDEQGIFQVVARHVMWDIASDGTILATTPLVDAGGTQLYAYDVNDLGEIAGVIYADNDPTQDQFPAVATFVDGQLQILPLINPDQDAIIGFGDMQIDNSGNLLGYGVEPGETIGYLPRAVIWPSSGGVIDVVSEFPYLNTAHGNGIATVDGVMQVVGDAHRNSGPFGSLYAVGELFDLTRLAEGDEPWEIRGAADVNHQGIICGHGRVGGRRDYRGEACLLVPTGH